MKRSFPGLCIAWILILGTPFISLLSSAETQNQVGKKGTGHAKTVPLHGIPTYVQKKIYKKIWKRKALDVSILSACIGDVDGDGLNELITTDGRRIRIYQWKYGRFRPLKDSTPRGKRRFFSFWPRSKESSKNPLEEINKENNGMRYLSLSTGDLDRDGKDEILFTGLRDHELFSGILGYEKESFTQSLSDSDLYLKILRNENGRPILVGQSLRPVANAAHRYRWDGTGFRKQNSITLPEGTDLLAVSSYRSGGTSAPAYVSFSNAGGLRFYTSELKEAANMEALRVPVQSSVRVRDQGKKAGKRRLRIQRRCLTGDFDGDGRDDVLLILKRPLIKLWGFRVPPMREMAADFVFTSDHILELWDTEPIFGEILDQAVGDVDNDGRDDLVLFTKKGLVPFVKGTRILIYELR